MRTLLLLGVFPLAGCGHPQPAAEPAEVTAPGPATAEPAIPAPAAPATVTPVPVAAEPAPEERGVGRVSPGFYLEVDAADVPDPVFGVHVEEVTPNIVEVRGRHGWVCFASYDAGRAEYRGFFEWQWHNPGPRSPGGKWADLYQVRIVRRADGMVVMTGRSPENDLLIRAVPDTRPKPSGKID